MNLSNLTWPAVAALSPDTPVVIPVAALEQHGHHLPVFTDSLLLGEVVRRISLQFSDQVLFAPLMWLGNLLLSATYWILGTEPVSGFEQKEMGPACEWETSMVLRIDPALAGD